MAVVAVDHQLVRPRLQLSQEVPAVDVPVGDDDLGVAHVVAQPLPPDLGIASDLTDAFFATPTVDEGPVGTAPEGGAGGTVFWDTGAVLFTHGLNKEAAAEYMLTLSTDMRVWEGSIVGNPDEGVTPVGQLPVTQMVWDELESNPPEWLTANPWANEIWASLPNAGAIVPTKLSVTQFNVAAPFYSAYLAGEVDDATTAMTQAWDAVNAELANLG